MDSKDKGDAFFSKEFSVEAKNDFFNHAFENSDYRHFPDDYKQHVLKADKHNLSAAWSKNSAIIIPSLTGAVPSENDADIMKRFAKVFEQAYIRFLDLQKAEDQAREAEIELALEKVRAKAMGMHNSEDISEATAVVFNELSHLGIEIERCGICIFKEARVLEVWSTTLSAKEKQVVDVITGYLDVDLHPMLQEIYRSWRDKLDFFAYELVGNEVKEYYELLKKTPDYRFPIIVKYPNHQIANCFYFNEGYIFTYTLNEIAYKDNLILRRFTNVFSLTYRRFLDLVNAEAQAREAQIEAALEKVRSRSLAMHRTEELQEAAEVLNIELNRLGLLNINQCGYAIYNEKNNQVLWLTRPDGTSREEFTLPIKGRNDTQ
ncbi:MAG: hypothetical protein U5K79_01650 [Cyclobacteriaceae bacterium]|nr:hypothetical protein [Cyclobacteriaceae bacterium]